MHRQGETSSEFLMARFRDRLDAEAFEQIVSRFLAPALAVARGILSEAPLAEDAVQETFLRIIRARGRYLASRPFSNWFYAILRNVCKDMLRRRARYAKAIRETAIRKASPLQRASAEADETSEILASVPKESRAVLTLRIVHDLPFRDVAAALGISEEAAKKRAQRALRRLRKHGAVLRLLRGEPARRYLPNVAESCVSADFSREVVPQSAS